MKDFEYYQHGDVLLGTVESFPEDIEKLNTNVLQEGEHTGHAHRLFEGKFEVFEQPKTKVKYLRVVEPVALRHEEHKQIDLPPGNYKIGIVKEFDPFEQLTRNVLD